MYQIRIIIIYIFLYKKSHQNNLSEKRIKSFSFSVGYLGSTNREMEPFHL